MTVRPVHVDADGTVTVRPGKVELGQGILTALAQLVAEELDVRMEQVRVVPARTDESPDEGYTSGSMSIQRSGAALRQTCAGIRAVYLAAAAEALGVDPGVLDVSAGEFVAPDGRRTSYAKLAADTALLDREPPDGVAPKPAPEHRVVGTSVARTDLPDKVAGRPRFVHDLARPDQLYGRVVRPPSRGAELIGLDSRAAVRAGAVAIVRDGSFLGVVAEREEVAVRAAELLRAGAGWRERPSLPDEARLAEFLTSAAAETTVLTSLPRTEGTVARTVSATYQRPYLAHASLAPSCAVAIVDGDALSVWSHSQGVFPLRRELAKALGRPVEQITVRHAEGAGCYGHNGADDVALDAALLASAVPGRPVQVVWSRQDELSWAPFGPSAVVRVSADLDAAGEILHWRHEIWGGGHGGRPGATEGVALLAATHTAAGAPMPVSVDMALAGGGGAGRNAVPPYHVGGLEVVNHRLLDMPLKTSSLRSLGAFLNVFAAESFVDELAGEAGADPVEYRLRRLADPRGRAIVEAAARRAGWSAAAGQGFGYARYKNSSAFCAVVAEVEVGTEVRVRRLTLAVDAGLVVNPDGVVNQIEGGAIQATSWTLKEQVRFDRLRVTSDTFASYPILRFTEVPEVDVEVLNRPDEPPLGVGEAAHGPTAAAIVNAVHSATGLRIRRLPVNSPVNRASLPA